MEIDQNRFEGAVPEVGRDLAHRGPAFEHVRGIAVAQGMDAEDLVLFIEPALDLRELQCGPDSGLAHGLGMAAERLPERIALLVPAASDAGKKPLLIAVGLPIKAQTSIELRRDRNLPGLPSLSVDDPDDEAFPVDVFGFDPERFTQPQATLIDDGEIGAVAAVSEGAQEEGNFLAREDMGKRLGAMDLDLFPDVPIAVEVVPIKETDRTQRLIDGRSAETPFLLEMDEEVENLGRPDPRRGDVRVMGIELPDPPEVVQLRLVAEIFEMDSPDEILVPLL